MRDPNVPESLEGWWILHRMFAFDRCAWDDLSAKRRARIGSQAADLFDHLKGRNEGDLALCNLTGHKGDLMLVHYARTYDELAYLQMLVDKLELRILGVGRRAYDDLEFAQVHFLRGEGCGSVEVVREAEV